jgi:hypothetical protein
MPITRATRFSTVDWARVGAASIVIRQMIASHANDARVIAVPNQNPIVHDHTREPPVGS